MEDEETMRRDRIDALSSPSSSFSPSPPPYMLSSEHEQQLAPKLEYTDGPNDSPNDSPSDQQPEADAAGDKKKGKQPTERDAQKMCKRDWLLARISRINSNKKMIKDVLSQARLNTLSEEEQTIKYFRALATHLSSPASMPCTMLADMASSLLRTRWSRKWATLHKGVISRPVDPLDSFSLATDDGAGSSKPKQPRDTDLHAALLREEVKGNLQGFTNILLDMILSDSCTSPEEIAACALCSPEEASTTDSSSSSSSSSIFEHRLAAYFRADRDFTTRQPANIVFDEENMQNIFVAAILAIAIFFVSLMRAHPDQLKHIDHIILPNLGKLSPFFQKHNIQSSVIFQVPGMTLMRKLAIIEQQMFELVMTPAADFHLDVAREMLKTIFVHLTRVTGDCTSEENKGLWLSNPPLVCMLSGVESTLLLWHQYNMVYFALYGSFPGKPFVAVDSSAITDSSSTTMQSLVMAAEKKIGLWRNQNLCPKPASESVHEADTRKKVNTKKEKGKGKKTPKETEDEAAAAAEQNETKSKVSQDCTNGVLVLDFSHIDYACQALTVAINIYNAANEDQRKNGTVHSRLNMLLPPNLRLILLHVEMQAVKMCRNETYTFELKEIEEMVDKVFESVDQLLIPPSVSAMFGARLDCLFLARRAELLCHLVLRNETILRSEYVLGGSHEDQREKASRFTKFAIIINWIERVNTELAAGSNNRSPTYDGPIFNAMASLPMFNCGKIPLCKLVSSHS